MSVGAVFAVFGGLEGRDGGRRQSPGVFCSFPFVSSFDLPLFFGFGVAQHLFQHERGRAFGVGTGGVELGLWGQDALVGVDNDFLYRLGFGAFGVGVAGGCGLGFGEVEAGDLETVEEKACATWVDVVGGDALQDLADGVLDGGAVFREWQVECGAAAAALAWVGDGLAGGVVVVAEVFSAEAWAGAAMSVGEDVAALVLLRCFGFELVHCVPPRVLFCAKSSEDWS